MAIVPRKGILLGVAAIHMAAAWFWLNAAPRLPMKDDGAPTLFLQLLKVPPPKVKPPIASAPRPTARLVRIRQPSPAAAPIALPAAAEPPASIAEPAAVPVAQTSPTADAGIDAIVTQAKRDAVAFDRATNKDRLKGITSFDNRPFARAIAGAFKSRPGMTTTREYVSGDGRRITKVISPHGTYCVISLENNSIMSESLSRQGATTRKIACPSD